LSDPESGKSEESAFHVPASDQWVVERVDDWSPSHPREMPPREYHRRIRRAQLGLGLRVGGAALLVVALLWIVVAIVR